MRGQPAVILLAEDAAPIRSFLTEVSWALSRSTVHFDLTALIKTIGYLGVFGFIFAESGLLIGLFLPGDSLLFTAGFLASQGYLDISVLVAGSVISAILGNSVGYAFGYRVGRRLFQREDSLIFQKRHLERAEVFYERHGGKAVVISRFMPIIRTFAPIVAGMGTMGYGRFLAFNVFGALLWAGGVTLSGYYLGSLIPDVDRYLLPIIAAILIVSILPSAIHLFREYRHDIFHYIRSRWARQETK